VKRHCDGLGLSIPAVETLGREATEDGHEDNKAFVTKWRAEQTERKEEELMSAAETIIAHVDERFDRIERLEAMRGQAMDDVRETVAQLAQRFPDDERVEDAVAEFLDEEDAGV
jgi:hypothetical protein